MAHRSDSGFTIAELTITIALVSLLAAPIIINGFQFYVGVNSADRRAAMYIQSQQALRAITEDLRMASGILSSSTITDPNKSGGWVTNNSTHVLVITTPVQNDARDFIMNASTGKPYQNEIIYYVDDHTLYKRTLPYSITGNAMVRSCPPASATASCPADIMLTDKFDTSSYTYYDASDTVTTTVTSARSIKITLQTKDVMFGQAAIRANTIQVTFRNT